MNCTKGWKSSSKVNKNFTFESRVVNICDNICDCADLCGITDCEYYDATREGTRRFINALNYEHTLEGVIEVQKKKAQMKAEKEKKAAI
jgi:hypothetical protein